MRPAWKRCDDRDAALDLPDRMLHALQMKLRDPEDEGASYLKISVNII